MAAGDIHKTVEDVPICKNCKHFRRSLLQILYFDYEFGKCRRPEGPVQINLITGKEQTRTLRRWASSERIDGECGIQGKYWFSDRKKDLFTLLKRSYSKEK